MQRSHEQLEEAFGAFNRLSEQLSSAYRDLEKRAADLAGELARSRQEKAQLADRLGALIDSLPGGVVVVDGDGLVNDCNATARQWLGDDLNGNDWNAALEAAAGQISDDGRDVSIGDLELTLSRRELEGQSETIFLLTDVSQARRLQAELDRHRRLAAMGEMAARLAHQVRTPLSSAVLYADHLTERSLDTDQRRRFGQRLMARLRDLEQMTRDMLGFVRGGCAVAENVDVAGLIDSVRQTLEPAFRQGRRLRTGAVLPGLVVRGDRRALTGALCNLIENAWQADEAATVRLEVSRSHNGWVDIRVEDDGPGIAAGEADRVFEPFHSGRSDGTGLGLAVARSVAEAHRGQLELLRHAPKGALFSLSLPLHVTAAGREGAARLPGEMA
ncbi:HAMP domain-containing histidine kinase [Wenzhouxiangella sp. AB-CW3]|uniref:sensor histidine kinase n=1 Tax=Wenzhouxiangella sp. AB-CW3 TaxID=2771012 RepID=UPI00168A88FA|nr:HAMP domain-containing sensor histidine kinase [Wenzhouxiangella sp. AB-CW3]QOC21207.1 HAMP domain-containing histidine kinase [Wenzhouxiangella sp. AB-CW3]